MTTLIETEIRPREVKLRGCQPRDLIEHALSLRSLFQPQTRADSRDLLSAACAGYFVSDERDVATA
mgnify:CR=1 FL=1